MADESRYTKKIHLMLLPNGQLALDTVFQDGSFEPLELDPEINLDPVTVQDLLRVLTDSLDTQADQDAPLELESILSHFELSVGLIKDAIKKRDG